MDKQINKYFLTFFDCSINLIVILPVPDPTSNTTSVERNADYKNIMIINIICTIYLFYDAVNN